MSQNTQTKTEGYVGEPFYQDPRIDRIESQIGELVTTSARTDANVNALTQLIGSQNARMNTFEARQAESQKVNYAPLAIVSSFIVAVAGVSGTLVASSISSESESRKAADISAERFDEEVRSLHAKIDESERQLILERIDGHVGRLGALIGVNTIEIEQIKSSRFDDARGSRLEADVADLRKSMKDILINDRKP